jgi:hypothetical protein
MGKTKLDWIEGIGITIVVLSIALCIWILAV